MRLYLSFVNLVSKYYTKDSFNWLWVLILLLLSFFPRYFRFLRSILKHLKEYSIHSFLNVMESSRVLLTPHSENFISMLMSKTAFIRFACTLYRFFHQSPSILLSLTIGKKLLEEFQNKQIENFCHEKSVILLYYLLEYKNI